MDTYRSELEKLDTYFEANKLHHSILTVQIYKILYWIKIKLGKKDGYIDWISQGKNPQIMTDVIQVLNLVLNDTVDQMEVVLGTTQIKSFKELDKVTRLIIENFDNPIRSNPNIIYDEDEDDETTAELDGNLLHKLENLLSIDNYLEESVANS